MVNNNEDAKQLVESDNRSKTTADEKVSVLGMLPTPGSEGEKAFVEVKSKSTRNHSSIMSVIKMSSDKLLV